MSALLFALAELKKHAKDVPASILERDVRFLELEIGRRTDDRGRVIVERRELRSAEEYAPRFEELLASGYAWVNVNLCGVLGNIVVVVVTVPAHTSSRTPPIQTSVNYSGPTKGVLANELDVAAALAFLDST